MISLQPNNNTNNNTIIQYNNNTILYSHRTSTAQHSQFFENNPKNKKCDQKPSTSIHFINIESEEGPKAEKNTNCVGNCKINRCLFAKNGQMCFYVLETIFSRTEEASWAWFEK